MNGRAREAAPSKTGRPAGRILSRLLLLSSLWPAIAGRCVTKGGVNSQARRAGGGCGKTEEHRLKDSKRCKGRSPMLLLPSIVAGTTVPGLRFVVVHGGPRLKSDCCSLGCMTRRGTAPMMIRANMHWAL
ncbi:hypothetical protein LCGC14_1463080 [marine sediment metagenome]|uniref:Uncharacterized protein n=1 Tax=marine sediment metagenome TaxID=412755 RepID=A0A0F9JF10_9ZZZZ